MARKIAPVLGFVTCESSFPMARNGISKRLFDTATVTTPAVHCIEAADGGTAATVAKTAQRSKMGAWRVGCTMHHVGGAFQP